MIAGNLTVNDWIRISDEIKRKPNDKNLIYEVFVFFEDRIHSRYINPIEHIIKNGKRNGEGFAVIALICSTIEALASCRAGQIYRYDLRNLKSLEKSCFYTNGKELFTNFLTNNLPFSHHFDKKIAIDFYKNIRCGLLHEAAINNHWKIRTDTDELILIRDGVKILNRDIFFKFLKNYLKEYKNEFINDEDVRSKLIRKYDLMCAQWSSPNLNSPDVSNTAME